jgi:hypothetical protein
MPVGTLDNRPPPANNAPVSPEQIQAALADITAEDDPTLKHMKLAGLVSTLFRERGVKLVVVGGSAIEFYTEGEYASGDIDLCTTSLLRPDLRMRQEVMGLLGAKGGPRSWEIKGHYVDILGELEGLTKKPLVELHTPYGPLHLSPPEELLVERVLVSVYPSAHEPSAECARTLIAVALSGQIEMDWNEVTRLAVLPEYRILPEIKESVASVAHELGRSSPYHS